MSTKHLVDPDRRDELDEPPAGAFHVVRQQRPGYADRRCRRPRVHRPVSRRHLYALNRRVLLAPLHNMALTGPTTTEADVDRHSEVFRSATVEVPGR